MDLPKKFSLWNRFAQGAAKTFFFKNIGFAWNIESTDSDYVDLLVGGITRTNSLYEFYPIPGWLQVNIGDDEAEK